MRSGQLEPVPHPGLGEDVFRFGGILLYLFPQLIDECAQVFNLVSVVGPPYCLKEPQMRERNVRMRNQVVKKVKLLWRQPDCPAPDSDVALDQIDLDLLESDHLRSSLRREGNSTQSSPDPGEQLRCAIWLGDKVIGSGIERFDLVLLSIPHSEHDDGGI